MLFNSFIFIFGFLPATLVLFFFTAKYSKQAALTVLFVTSIIFYGWNNYHYVFLLFFSIVINFLIGKYIITTTLPQKKYLLFSGVIFNLLLLAYFKYFNFFIENLNIISHNHFESFNIVLPIGISFFTFTQIAFLVDSYRGLVQKYHLLNYALFVTYYPHLIAGPIIHHKEVMPQFTKSSTFSFSYRNFSIGIILFSIGLFKKTILADNLGAYVSPIYDIYSAHISLLDAWISSLAYTLELYFDFSGYSDMAIGLSLLIGIKLPVNFYSPYKSLNIIEFWRRWNMTLSRFLRDYLYIPLGGNRKGPSRRYLNLMITMFLGGLWHGASWTFVVWGCLHGIYLCCNHWWATLKKIFNLRESNTIVFRVVACLFTFVLVMVAWVFFRAPNFSTAHAILHAMFFNPLILPNYWPIPFAAKIFLLKLHVSFSTQTTWMASDTVASLHAITLILISLIIVWFMPNSYQIMHKYRPALISWENIKSRLTWKPNLVGTCTVILVFILDIIYVHASSIFLYFRF
ncbi:MAG: hypothetical protein A3I77_03945 [Gammaproteobacteria bacterium RIFCSPLOWO2_02_FULL_42_14]|nr:MAG: hypothetical protein A3B71_05250 [Gammaproteobacteria bacterium RIFCSPHIGHO2_02_FULL_42_43]OGT27519.1 MAG: hypothetical protein A2624_03700 [Gammaproteobacteria bacterium RIFCSPHIGHO2_01_FULL_42_8]OGT51403.1 MAG: hypothetical protein A3E54_05015 [Gammaproteobacteria bacterium RIFCSPHIGHO2_12_FULL_41_25]OGT62105.1 MAG: hypothetical protein A3I77_03945 [Gammaproteobacteria bacterium RIFCSPLOWO2_02_FULL_42_14]OGT85777.1 MAG: hypothetical protein A3G86_03640 [Gammaproteobacteria bacterium R